MIYIRDELICLEYHLSHADNKKPFCNQMTSLDYAMLWPARQKAFIFFVGTAAHVKHIKWKHFCEIFLEEKKITTFKWTEM